MAVVELPAPQKPSAAAEKGPTPAPEDADEAEAGDEATADQEKAREAGILGLLKTSEGQSHDLSGPVGVLGPIGQGGGGSAGGLGGLGGIGTLGKGQGTSGAIRSGSRP